MDTLLETGDFEASTNTRSEATGEVLRLIVDEFWRLQRERVSERELSGAKAYMTGSFPLTIETPDAIATQVLNVLFYGLPVEQLQSFRSRVNAVTPDDIERVARTYLKPDRLSVVLVGNAAAFRAAVARARLQHLRSRRDDRSRFDGRGFQTGRRRARPAAWRRRRRARPAARDDLARGSRGYLPRRCAGDARSRHATGRARGGCSRR